MGKRIEYEMIGRSDLLYRIKSLESLRDRALVSFLYLSGCRVEEVVRYYTYVCPECGEKLHSVKGEAWKKHCRKHGTVERRKGVVYGEPIKKSQIEFKDDLLVILNVRTLKRRKKLNRNIPILVEDDREFIDMIKEYMADLKLTEEQERADKPESPILFNLCRQRVYQITRKIYLKPHWLRHLRLTHLTIDYGLTDQDLKQYTGWSDSRPANVYVHLNWANLANKMRKR